jgi:phosphatidylserine/phosphatidylglycerophosphate/cardiolipin synthase-like enzyme
MSGDDNKEMTEFYQALVDQQRAGRDVRIIIRDASEFPGPDSVLRQQELIERLKKFGFDTSPDGLRLQKRCHTKALIVDSKKVLFGSQNLTNGGALHNRDASLLVRSPDSVAKYFEEVFEYDWDNRTHNEADESVGGIRRAGPGEPTPVGFRRVSLAELLGDD